MDINRDILLIKGFEEIYDKGFADFGDMYIYTKTIISNHQTYYIEIKSVSNMKDRNWSIHIDNCDCDSIASICVQTIEHINSVFKLLDIEYTL